MKEIGNTKSREECKSYGTDKEGKTYVLSYTAYRVSGGQIILRTIMELVVYAKDLQEAIELSKIKCEKAFPDLTLTDPTWFEITADTSADDQKMRVFLEELREGFRCAKELYPREKKFEASYEMSMNAYHEEVDKQIVKLGGESVLK